MHYSTPTDAFTTWFGQKKTQLRNKTACYSLTTYLNYSNYVQSTSRLFPWNAKLGDEGLNKIVRRGVITRRLSFTSCILDYGKSNGNRFLDAIVDSNFAPTLSCIHPNCQGCLMQRLFALRQSCHRFF